MFIKYPLLISNRFQPFAFGTEFYKIGAEFYKTFSGFYKTKSHFYKTFSEFYKTFFTFYKEESRLDFSKRLSKLRGFDGCALSRISFDLQGA